MINKAVDSNQSAVSNQLMRMLRDEQVAAYLNNCKGEVEAALRSMEAIKMLADTVVDSSHVNSSLTFSFHRLFINDFLL